MGKSDAMIDLIELLVDKTSMISEKDLEIYLLIINPKIFNQTS